MSSNNPQLDFSKITTLVWHDNYPYNNVYFPTNTGPAYSLQSYSGYGYTGADTYLSINSAEERKSIRLGAKDITIDLAADTLVLGGSTGSANDVTIYVPQRNFHVGANATGMEIGDAVKTVQTTIYGDRIYLGDQDSTVYMPGTLSIQNISGANAFFNNITGGNLSLTGAAVINEAYIQKLNVNSYTGNLGFFEEITTWKATKLDGDQLWDTPSDVRVKKDIADMPVEDCMNSINKIRIRNFDYIPEYQQALQLPPKRNIGVIADELQQTHPDSVIVKDGTKFGLEEIPNFKTVNLSSQIYEVIGSLQYLFKEVQELKRKIQ